MPVTAVVQIRRLISYNKAVSAGVTALAGSLGGALASWIGSGEFDATEIRLSGGALALSVVVAVATWATSAGKAEIEPQIDQTTAADPVPNEVVIQPV